MSTAFRAATLFLLLAALSSAAGAANWPAWRGPSGTGISSETDVPLRWSDKQNVRWRISLPGPGNSSPIVWGTRLFVTQAIENENRRALMCLDRSDGMLLWQSRVAYTQDEPTHSSNPYCAASPVTDGERVLAFFGSAGLFCYDFGGKELWHRDLGRITHMAGYGASPILYSNLCILNFGPGENAALIAVNKNSGETVWRVEAPKSEVKHPPPASPQSEGHARPGGGRFLAWAMFTGADTNQDEQITAQEFRELAQRAGMEYAQSAGQQLLCDELPDSIDSFARRANEVTSLLDDILNGQTPPPAPAQQKDSSPVGRQRNVRLRLHRWRCSSMVPRQSAFVSRL
jgi:hypothetical protein